MKRCKHIKGFSECGSYAFNLHADGIDQGDLCDVHYWQDQAKKISDPVAMKTDEGITLYTGWDDIPAGTELNTFHPDYNTEAVLVEEMQRMAAELKAITERPWVGLTEERIRKIWLKGKDHGDDWADVLALAKAFDAELKRLNT